MRKKIFAGLLLFGMLLAALACKNEQESTSEESVAQESRKEESVLQESKEESKEESVEESKEETSTVQESQQENSAAQESRSENIPEPDVSPDEVWYYEPIHAYLRNEAIVFEYEAGTTETSGGEVREAALALGRLFLEELCSKEYDPEMSGKHIVPLSSYYVKAYKEVTISLLENSCERTAEKLGDDIPEGFSVMGRETWLRHLILETNENIWQVQYLFLAKSDDPLWGDGGEEFMDCRDIALYKQASGLLIKDGSKYYFVQDSLVVTESRIKWEE